MKFLIALLALIVLASAVDVIPHPNGVSSRYFRKAQGLGYGLGGLGYGGYGLGGLGYGGYGLGYGGYGMGGGLGYGGYGMGRGLGYGGYGMGYGYY